MIAASAERRGGAAAPACQVRASRRCAAARAAVVPVRS